MLPVAEVRMENGRKGRSIRSKSDLEETYIYLGIGGRVDEAKIGWRSV
jgi:hypothetical protein